MHFKEQYYHEWEAYHYPPDDANQNKKDAVLAASFQNSSRFVLAFTQTERTSLANTALVVSVKKKKLKNRVIFMMGAS
ncbi:MAG: hypothetical protein DWQ04_03410 [Chloroflexi bacterium]|nr:MAG: hypothetical protein DWQ04_03410 [Chloroflexota bacterium]